MGEVDVQGINHPGGAPEATTGNRQASFQDACMDRAFLG